jgi:uncharacterized SAM-binding protein YcdF (DUF218 family)
MLLSIRIPFRTRRRESVKQSLEAVPFGNRSRELPFTAIRRSIFAALIFGAAAIYALSTPVPAGIIFRSLEVYAPIESSRWSQLASDSSAAIVILSAGRRTYAPEFGGETVDALTLERVRYGAYVARQTNLPILVSGGLGAVSLAELMSRALQTDYAITPKWQETESRNTAENAIFSSTILQRSGIRRIILVTHAWHMKRAVAAFSANGLTVTPAPTAFYLPVARGFWSAITPNLSTLRMSGYGIHETVGYIWYKVRYGY